MRLISRMGLSFTGDKMEKIKGLLGTLAAQNRVYEMLVSLKDMLVEKGMPVSPELEQAVAAGGFETAP